MQHRVATLLVQHDRRHQNHPTRNPFLKSRRFRLCLVQAAVVNLFVLNLVGFISVCPCILETGRLENTYSRLKKKMWYLALVLAGCCFVNFVCFEFVVLHFRLPIYPKRETGRLSNTYVQRRNKKDLAPPSRARGSTWGLFLQVC